MLTNHTLIAGGNPEVKALLEALAQETGRGRTTGNQPKSEAPTADSKRSNG